MPFPRLVKGILTGQAATEFQTTSASVKPEQWIRSLDSKHVFRISQQFPCNAPDNDVIAIKKNRHRRTSSFLQKGHELLVR